MSVNPAETPVLIIIFNRPDKVEELIKALEKVQPRHLYISADGPRSHVAKDIEMCQKARTAAMKVNWDCEVYTNFSVTNSGCKRGVEKAISWFFSNVPEGIILEDDCIPTPSFFRFCTENLYHYRDNHNIMHINGTTFLNNIDEANNSRSYYFSNIPLVWGWATWSRAWKMNDIDMKNIPEAAYSLRSEKRFLSSLHTQFWINLFNHVQKKNVDTWDTQWVYSIMKSHGICITPTKNLINNIGFDSEATHTKEENIYKVAVLDLEDTLSHPSDIKVDMKQDYKIMEKIFVNSFSKKIKLALGVIFKTV